MKNRLKIVLSIACLSLFAFSCTTTPSFSQMESDLEGFDLPKTASLDESIVYIIRPSKYGFAINFKVYVDKKEQEYFVGSTKGGQYIYFSVTPGSHNILSQAENLAEYQLNAERSQIYFLEQIPKTGILFARNNLIVTEETKGKYYVKMLKPGEMK